MLFHFSSLIKLTPVSAYMCKDNLKEMYMKRGFQREFDCYTMIGQNHAMLLVILVIGRLVDVLAARGVLAHFLA